MVGIKIAFDNKSFLFRNILVFYKNQRENRANMYLIATVTFSYFETKFIILISNDMKLNDFVKSI